MSSGVEQLVDHVKANISGDGGDVRRKRELGTIDGTNRSIVDMEALVCELHKMVTSSSICSVRISHKLAPFVLFDMPLKCVDFPTRVEKEKRRGTKGRVAVDAGFRN